MFTAQRKMRQAGTVAGMGKLEREEATAET